jgi:hypothetical protein
VPTAREIRVQSEGAVDQRHHGAHILAEKGKHLRGVRQDARVVTGDRKG